MAARLTPTNLWLFTSLAGVSAMIGLLAGINPKLAIAASIAIAFVLLVSVDLTAGMAVFGFFSFLELLNLGSAISVGKLGGLLLAIGWIAFVLTRRDVGSDFLSAHPGMSLVLGLFLGWAALSALWAESIPVVRDSLGRYALNVVLFMIVFTAVRDRRQATTVVTGFLAGAVGAGIYGLFFAGELVQGYGGRLTASNLDPNELASVLVAGIALSVGLAAGVKKRPELRLLALISGGFCLITALLTGSRGGVIALAAVLVAGVIFGGRWRSRTAALGLLLSALAVFYIAALAPSQVQERIKSPSEDQALEREGRATLWKIGERMISANPVEGVGAGNFQTSSRHYLLEPGAVYRSDVILQTPSVAHNTYMQIAAELGFIGLALFIAIVGFSVGGAVRAAWNFRDRGDTRGEALARAVTVAMIGLLVADMFISQMFNKQLWLMLGIGPALLAASKRSGPSGAEQAT